MSCYQLGIDDDIDSTGNKTAASLYFMHEIFCSSGDSMKSRC